MSLGPSRRTLISAGVLGGLSLCAPARAAEPQLIRHSLIDLGQPRSYRFSVLKLLLDKTMPRHGAYQLQHVESGTQSRALLQLQQGELDVWASMSSQAREAAAIPIRVCLRRGLNGIRLPIGLHARRLELDAVADLSTVRQLRFAQVESWPDSQVLERNGFKLQRIQRLELFEDMLRLGRFDLFALAADEAHGIVEPMRGIKVLEQWALAYPSVYYFFVNSKRPELAERLREGWDLALSDGSFFALFEQWAGPEVARARLAQRRWLALNNPDLPLDSLPLQDKRLWHPLVRERLYRAGKA
ncbi:hypothetical protein RQP53_21270 [Paucibacter sp. APW11]|uniref:Solute-binding protein family 3/N-terminal domain-containing protein n=1 Tax=Roseateles aquae TaxID=3077235 RepID=A0ABU3PGV1_9BURK|nr:hypothetical protein [Paucibacter sp. APW11]MDT9001821.1 hypothetical protein [Paucibacter sp. APW11]